MSMADSALQPNGFAAPLVNVSLSDHTIDSRAEVGPVTATMTFDNTGVLSGTFYTEGIAPTQQWLDAVSAPDAALYSIMVTLVSGTTPTTGTMDTWQNLGTTRTWTNVRNTKGFANSNLLVKIRRDSDSVEMASVSILLQAAVWPEPDEPL